MRLLSFGGFHGSDDSAYARLAHLMVEGRYFSGDFDGLPVYQLRLGVVAPVAMGFLIFGVNEMVLVAYPFVLSLVGVIFAFYAGRMLLNERAGYIAALLAAVVPIDCRLASYLLPDLPSALYANIGIILLFAASKRDELKHKAIYAAIGGICFGLSWMTKVSVVYLLPFATGYLLWLAFKNRRDFIIFVSFYVVFFLILLGETLFFYCHTGDILYRYHTTESNYELSKMWFFNEGTMFGWEPGHYYEALFNRIFITGPKVIFLDSQFGGLALAALLTTVLSFFRKFRHLRFTALWFLSLVIMFNFGSTSLASYKPLPMFAKFLIPLMLPSILCVAGLLAHRRVEASGKPEGAGSIAVPRVMALLIVIIFCAMGFWANFLDGPQNRLERDASTLAGPDDIVYTDNRTMPILEFFWQYPDETRLVDFYGMSGADIPVGSYVLVNKNRLVFLNEFYDMELPDFYGSVPGNWEVILDGREGELYLVQ